MKKYFIIIILSILSFAACKQNNNNLTEDDPRQGRLYKSEKIGFFTKQMNLSENEAQRFWPIYNKYDKERDSLWRTKRHFIMNYEQGNLDVNNAGEALNQFLHIDVEKDSLRSKFVRGLKTFLSDEKILQMFSAEHQFKFFMLNRIRGRHGNPSFHGRSMRHGKNQDHTSIGRMAH